MDPVTAAAAKIAVLILLTVSPEHGPVEYTYRQFQGETALQDCNEWKKGWELGSTMAMKCFPATVKQTEEKKEKPE